jgi:hypothetical protein
VSHQQEVSLSIREQQVLRLLMAEGRSIPEISRERLWRARERCKTCGWLNERRLALSSSW